jgi:hypothetical protein
MPDDQALEHEGQHEHREVRIHIDRKRYDSPNPTTGEALYVLGHIKPEHRLYREVHGDREDQPIENNAEPVHLTEDEHFYSEEVHHHEYTIIVNAREKHVATKKLSFEAVVALAFPNPPSGQDMIYTVAYRNGVHDQQGTLTTGHSVRIKNGMIFDVTATNRS